VLFVAPRVRGFGRVGRRPSPQLNSISSLETVLSAGEPALCV
jgi:hypothetical protein